MPSIPDQVLIEITSRLDRLGIDYSIGGSVASGFHGQPRSTNDIHLLAWLTPESAAALAAAVRDTFYVPEDSMRTAVRARSSFNLIHLKYAYKVDVFAAGDSLLDRAERIRRAPMQPFRGAEERVWVAAPELVVLRKLDWYRRAGGSLARQWPDLLGVLRLNFGSLDLPFMQAMAHDLGLAELLERALAEARPPD